MFSCDTIAVCAAYSTYHTNIFGKNSDRPTGEPQPLRIYAGGEYGEGDMVQTTYRAIPQVKKTYGVIGCQPYWIWGFEMGFNEKGLIIGNEAEGSRMDPETEEGLLGMDLLRLALERAATAREGIEVITALLKQYGQKAVASALTNRTYENTFILVDPKEAWVLETAGRQWAAKQITTMQGISNCYSIGTQMDMVSEEAERISRQKRFLAPWEPFDFAKAYTGRLVNQPMGVQRYRRLNHLLQKQNQHDFTSLAAIFRDHHEGELIEPRFGAAAGTFLSVCMHMRDWGESETTASLLARYDEELGIVARYAPAQPCLSAYIPVYFTGTLPEKMQQAEKEYQEDSLWWQLKELGLWVTVDEDAFADDIRQWLGRLEADFMQRAELTEEKARLLIRKGQNQEANLVLENLTLECTERLFAAAKEQNQRLKEWIREKGGLYGRQKEAIEKYMEYSKISHF